MSEIKSTLDLVMEKTKHLSMSKEEKAAQQKDDLIKTVKGLILKFNDQLLTQEQFGKELKSMEQTYAFEVRSELIHEVLGEIDLDHDNVRRMVILKEICAVDTALLETVLTEYRKSVTSAKEKRILEIKEQLHASRRISGSAVVPNLETDTGWQQAIASIKENYRKRLEQVKAELRSR